MIRLFIAIDIPEDIKMWLQGMGSSIPKARAVPDHQLHLTLKFIGDVESSVVLDIEENLSTISFSQFEIRLKGVGTFPPRGTPRVLWVGVEGNGTLTMLRNRIESSLSDLGIPRSKKKYTPHITLARLNKSPVGPLQNFLAGNSLLETPPFSVSEFTLYSSQLTPRGAIHTCRRTYLAGRE